MKIVKYKQVGKSNVEIDKCFNAKAPGWRISKTGNKYFENRKNRSDKPGTRV